MVRRTTLLVHDLDASIAFYRLLGFERWFEGPPGKVSAKGLPVDGVLIGQPTRFVIMRGRDPYLGMVGLLQYGPPRPLPTRGRLKAGDAILMIETRDLAAKAVALKAAGHPMRGEIVTTRVQSVGGAWDAKFLYILDRYNHMVEVTERLN